LKVDKQLRALERESRSGDAAATARLERCRARAGIETVYEGGNVITTLIGKRAKIDGAEIVGKIVAAYVPSIASRSSSATPRYNDEIIGNLHFVIVTDDGKLLGRPFSHFSLIVEEE